MKQMLPLIFLVIAVDSLAWSQPARLRTQPLAPLTSQTINLRRYPSEAPVRVMARRRTDHSIEIVRPDPSVDYAIVRVTPDPGVDYSIQIVRP